MRAYVKAFATLLTLQLGSRYLHMVLRQQFRKQPTARTSLTDLPAAALCSIIALADKESRLALFRTSAWLRDAVLGYGAVGHTVAAGRQTHLSLQTDVRVMSHRCPAPLVGASDHLGGVMQPGPAAGSAIKLLQLASHSAHDVNLHLCSSFTLQQALERIRVTQTQTGGSTSGVSNRSGRRRRRRRNRRRTPSTNSNNSGVGSNGGRGGTHDDNWLLDVMDPFLHIRTSVMPLQHITTLWLQDMVLHHPMPLCVGLACPNLKAYGLQNVAWSCTKVIWCWPQVQQLTLKDVCHPDMSLVFTAAALPHLSSLKVAWSSVFYKAQQQRTPKVGPWEYGYIIKHFCEQLTTLQLEGFSWVNVMIGTLGTVCTKVSNLSVSNQLENDYLLFMTESVPNVQNLRIGTLGLAESFRHVSDCRWEKLLHLQIDSLVGDTMSALARLSQMPQLCLVTLPTSITPTAVVVGPNWLSDVAKVLPAGAASRCCQKVLPQWGFRYLLVTLRVCVQDTRPHPILQALHAALQNTGWLQGGEHKSSP